MRSVWHLENAERNRPVSLFPELVANTPFRCCCLLACCLLLLPVLLPVLVLFDLPPFHCCHSRDNNPRYESDRPLLSFPLFLFPPPVAKITCRQSLSLSGSFSTCPRHDRITQPPVLIYSRKSRATTEHQGISQKFPRTRDPITYTIP